MRRCLLLAARARGACSPNPMVGAVLVKGGRLLGEAWHRRAGSAHAEAAVLSRAGVRARGATLYVNLEPCAHFGRTPPCVRSILDAGVARVVVAHRDPHPLVRGRGLAILRRAGVRVEVGLLRHEALKLNEAWLTRVLKGRPFVRVKAAMTIDGRIATAGGDSRWITSPASRALAHRMRSEHDAILVGAGTVLKDDPRLTARGAKGELPRQPVRVVLDSGLRIPSRARLLAGRAGKTGGRVLVYTTRSAPESRAAALRARGAEVIRLGRASGAATGGRVPMREVLADLAHRGITSLLIEGGGEVIASALGAGIVDTISFFIAPAIVGGRGSVPVVGGPGARRLASAFSVREISLRRVGPDLLLEGRVGGRRG